MPSTDDISWQVLRGIVCDWLGSSAELDEVRPLVGGSVNNTLSLHTRDGNRAVLKISTHRVNRDLEREGRQLELLRKLGFPTPAVYLCHTGTLDHPFSYLLMEYADGTTLAHAKDKCEPAAYDKLQEHLADLVSGLHDQTSERYQRVAESNGAVRTFDSWPAFYRSVYEHALHEVDKIEAIPVKSRKCMHRVHEKLDALIAHDDIPRLVHWDIWGTNVLVAPDTSGEWRVTALLDPNCKFAHAEAEIAYMELFHTVNAAFLKRYRTRHKLTPEYHALRKLIYQMYPLVHHVHVFGQEYVKPLLGVVDRLAGIV